MKIKRILTLILCLGISIVLVGCGNQNTTNAVANNLDKNTTQLETILDKLQDVNYKNIIIEEISPLSDETFNTTTATSALKRTKWYNVTGNKTSNFVPTKISAEKRRDAKYVSQNNVKKIGLNKQNADVKNTIKYVGKPTHTDNVYRQQNDNLTYKPKYINNVSQNFNRNCLDNYLAKIEVIYEQCADCISCNAECKNEKVVLEQNINDCRTLIKKMRDGTIKLSAENISNCNNCLNSLSESTKRLGSTKNNVLNKEKSIMELKNNFTQNKDKLETAYNKLFEALENRLDALCECNDNLSCICNTINNSKIDMTDAIKNKSDEDEIKDYEQEEMQSNQTFQNFQSMNETSKNQSNYPDTTLQNQPSTQTNIAPQQPYNNGYYVNNYNNGFGYNYGNGIGYNAGYPYPPRNTDTYGFITKNIDTYRPYTQTQISQSQNDTQQTETETETSAPIPNPFEEPDIKGIKEKIKKPFQNNEENQEKEGPVRPRKRNIEKSQNNKKI